MKSAAASLAIFLAVGLGGSALGQEQVNPRDVYPLIVSIVNQINEIRAARNIHTPIEHIPLDQNKTPTEVYEQVYELLLKIHALAARPAYGAGKEWTLPERREGRKIPADVLALLQVVEQRVGAIQKIVGVKAAPPLLIPQPGKTPPDVYQQVSKAIALIETL